MAKRVVLVDGSWLIFRAFFAIPASFRTTAGLQTNAVYGFAAMFRKLLAGKTPDYCAVVFDAKGPTFRDEKFPEYKANRPSMPLELVEQLPWIDKVVETHQVKLFRIEGYEADDVIGTLSRQASDAGMDVVIVSGDKDFAQLVTDNVRMMDTMRDVTYDPELVRKKWGVRPDQIIDLLALMGDKVDNVPGIPGIGQKGAAQLLEQYSSIAGIYEHLDELKGKRRQNLDENRELARLCQELVTIDQFVPLPFDLNELAVTIPDPNALNELYTALEFYSLLAQDPRESEETLDAEGTYEVVSDVADLKTRLNAIGASPTAIFPLFAYESAPPDGGGLAGIAFANDSQPAFYLPLLAPGDEGLGEEAIETLKVYAENPNAPKLTHEAKLLIRELKRFGIDTQGIQFDTMLASFLVDPKKHVPHDIGKVTKGYLHRVLTKAKAVVGSGRSLMSFAGVEASRAGAYACHVAEAIFKLVTPLQEAVEEAGLTEHLLTHELPLCPVIADMELAGILVDRQDLENLSKEFGERLEGYRNDIYALAGREFNIASTKQLAVVLFEELELPVLKKTKTGYSTAADVLEKLAKDHEIVSIVLKFRKLSKLINTYTDVLQKAIQPSTGRVHATFRQTTAATGRLSTTDPDLQRTPIKTAEGRRIREAFVAPEGHSILSADWSQIELRLLAHITKDPQLVEAFQTDADIHRRTASGLFSVSPEAVTDDQRGVGKLVNFATIYGQGATALAQTLGIPRKQAKAYIANYFEIYADVRRWLDATIEQAKEIGYVTTLMGRRRLIPELFSKNPMERGYGERIAANTPIQGSAADICKAAMLEIPAQLKQKGLDARMLMQIHDELVFEVPHAQIDATRSIVRDVMEHHVTLDVPLRVDIGVGTSWEAAH